MGGLVVGAYLTDRLTADSAWTSCTSVLNVCIDCLLIQSLFILGQFCYELVRGKGIFMLVFERFKWVLNRSMNGPHISQDNNSFVFSFTCSDVHDVLQSVRHSSNASLGAGILRPTELSVIETSHEVGDPSPEWSVTSRGNHPVQLSWRSSNPCTRLHLALSSRIPFSCTLVYLWLIVQDVLDALPV